MQTASSLPLIPASESPPALHVLKELISVPVSLQFDSGAGKTPWRRDRLPTPVSLGFRGGSAGKESTRNVGDPGLIPGLGGSPGEGEGYLLQCSGLEKSMDWIGRGVAESRTRLSDFHILSPLL